MAKRLETESPLTEAMVRPEVARAYAAAPVGDLIIPMDDQLAVAAPELVTTLLDELGVDAVFESAIALDAGVLTYAASRREVHCATNVIIGTRADERRPAACTRRRVGRGPHSR